MGDGQYILVLKPNIKIKTFHFFNIAKKGEWVKLGGMVTIYIKPNN